MNANKLADELEKRHLLGGYASEAATMLRQQQAEIERLIMLCDCMTTESNRKGKEIEDLKANSVRYEWLRTEFAHGRETYLAEGMPSGESLDKYIDGKLK